MYSKELSPTSHTCCDRPHLPCLACLMETPAVDARTGKREIYTKVAKIPVMFYAPPELHDRVAATARECGTSMAGFCRTAVSAYLESLERGQ